MRILQLFTIVALICALVPIGLAQDASSFKTLYSFTGQPDGGDPLAGVVIGPNGALYGTTSSGGTSNLGTVFQLKPATSPGGAWTETVLHNFSPSSGDGTNPDAGVVIGTGGVLYGTTFNGGTSGQGTVFTLAPPTSPGSAWTEAVLYSFQGAGQGAYPWAPLVIGTGALYGTTHIGGICVRGCSGVTFELRPPALPGGAWTETVLSNSVSPMFGAGLVIGKNGVLYGTSSIPGWVYSLVPPVSVGGAWTYSVLWDFAGQNGVGPEGSLVVGSNAVLYGTTVWGGTGSCSGGYGGCGTVYALTPPASPGAAWIETVLHSFTGGGDGAYPQAALVIGKNGVLYGTTSGSGASHAGTVFQLTPPTTPGGAWTETVLHRFTGGGDGAYPQAALVIGTNGVLYGTASSGGASNAGTVFALRP